MVPDFLRSVLIASSPRLGSGDAFGTRGLSQGRAGPGLGLAELLLGKRVRTGSRRDTDDSRLLRSPWKGQGALSGSPLFASSGWWPLARPHPPPAAQNAPSTARGSRNRGLPLSSCGVQTGLGVRCHPHAPCKPRVFPPPFLSSGDRRA